MDGGRDPELPVARGQHHHGDVMAGTVTELSERPARAHRPWIRQCRRGRVGIRSGEEQVGLVDPGPARIRGRTAPTRPGAGRPSRWSGSSGSSDWPRAGEISWVTPVSAANSTTGRSTDKTMLPRPRVASGERTDASPERPSRVSRRLFSTTRMLDSPMAMAATSGSSRPKAARGRAEML